MKWEYKTLKLTTGGLMGGKFDENVLDEKMNALGREGWEIVKAFNTLQTQGASRDLVIIFKRPLK